MSADRPYPALADALAAALGTAAVRAAEPLARYTAWRVGGPADLLVVAESVEALRQAMTIAWQQGAPCRVLGGGSNVLVSDAGVRGLIVLNRARAVTFAEDAVHAESGASFLTLARQCVARGLAGLEWAAGIPGTVGGAVAGNAGAWGSEVAANLIEATVLEPVDRVEVWPVERFEYGYRSSVLKQHPAGGQQPAIVLQAAFALQAGSRQELEARVAAITAQRKARQPPGATCGSVFKNPPGDYAGRLVEAADLKGHRIGGAVISPAHANFIVNDGQATADDVKTLIDLARETVQARFGVALELEIELLGSW